MIQIIIMVAQLILGLSILVGLHELGHLLAARLFGMRVEKYFIGFPPTLYSKKIGETEYGIGAIPLGGFVKISGMLDESLDTSALASTPQHYEFRAKPAWQRLIVMIGGIFFNVVTAIVIFSCLVYKNGDTYLPVSEAKHGIVAFPIAQEIGLKTYDKIIGVNGKPITSFNEALAPDVLMGKNTVYNIERDGIKKDIILPGSLINKLSDAKSEFISPVTPFAIGKLSAGYPADKAGILPKDKITAINGEPIAYFHQLQAALSGLKNKTVPIELLRNGQPLTVTATVNGDGKLGFQPEILLNFKTNHYTFAQSIPKGAEMAFGVVTLTIKGFSKIFTGEVSASNSFQGPIAMAQDLYGGVWDWDNFWRITGLISMALAFFNLLPIPALDGGHVVFLGYEILSRRKPSEKVLEWSQKVGMVMLLSLMVFVVFNDIFKRIF